ncbi:MAG: hydroxymethylbilane synthase [Candidatus Omnitrophica bacterium]|nr:hydroxymethylbilane synthase [Candidatus Omnitrophota bacterium]
MQRRIIVGARGSRLSVYQAKEVIGLLKKKFPKYRFILKKITTKGDRIKNWDYKEKGIFVKEIEDYLIKGKIDLAVHSMKDLPIDIPEELKIAAITKRESAYDVLIINERKNLKKIQIIGTSSLRRKAQILNWRPDLRVEDLRGNLDTRIKKLKEGKFDGIIVAEAGIERLGLKGLFFKIIPREIMLPAAGQGALGIEIRKEDKFIEEMVNCINDLETSICINCERAFLKEIGGGCRLPLGALAEIKNKRIHLEVKVISLDGKKVFHLRGSTQIKKGEDLARRLARLILKKGAKEILEDARR